MGVAVLLDEDAAALPMLMSRVGVRRGVVIGAATGRLDSSTKIGPVESTHDGASPAITTSSIVTKIGGGHGHAPPAPSVPGVGGGHGCGGAGAKGRASSGGGDADIMQFYPRPLPQLVYQFCKQSTIIYVACCLHNMVCPQGLLGCKTMLTQYGMPSGLAGMQDKF